VDGGGLLKRRRGVPDTLPHPNSVRLGGMKTLKVALSSETKGM